MSHSGKMIRCDGPDCTSAFDGVPLMPRNGALDMRCPVCRGHGQWNSEIDLVSFRCTRAICDFCSGNGWVETGEDPVALPDIILAPEGYPKWITQLVPRAALPQHDLKAAPLHKSSRKALEATATALRFGLAADDRPDRADRKPRSCIRPVSHEDRRATDAG